MATWPATLPCPQKKPTITPGSTLKRRKLQSGRTEVRRFGDGAPDTVQVIIRFMGNDFAEFEHFYARDLNMGINYFDAPWLVLMGYEAHKARILGYLQRNGKRPFYDEYSITLLVQRAEWCFEDVGWPSAAQGAAPPPLPVGYLSGFGLPPVSGVARIVNSVKVQGDLPGFSLPEISGSARIIITRRTVASLTGLPMPRITLSTRIFTE